MTSNQRRYQANRDAYRAAKLEAGACKVCARPYDPQFPGNFGFDHTDPKTKIRVYAGSVLNLATRFGIPTMLAEIRLWCELLCTSCHKWKTRFDRLADRQGL